MQSAVSTSHNQNSNKVAKARPETTKLSNYEQGVKYQIVTRDGEYGVNATTANYLANVLVNNPEIRFVTVNTDSGKKTLNVGWIGKIEPDETRARLVISYLHAHQNGDPKDSPPIRQYVDSNLKQCYQKPLTDAEWDYFMSIVDTEREDG